MDGIRATPYINPLLGSVNELVGGLLGYMRDPRRTQQLQGLAGLLESTGVPKTLERLAYGEPLTNIQRANVPVLRPETAEALLTLSPVPRATSRAAMAAGRAGERMAERVVPQIMERGGMPAGLLQDLAQGSVSRITPDASRLGSITRESFVPGVEAGKEMIVHHNISPEKLARVEKIGGMPVPSLAVSNVENPMMGFGDISLIGSKNMAIPSAKNPVYGFDAYTSRTPSIEYVFDAKSSKNLDNLFSDVKDSLNSGTIYNLKDNWKDRQFNDAMKAKFLKEKGMLAEPDKFKDKWDYSRDIGAKVDQNWKEYTEWVNEFDRRLPDAGVNIQERIFKGYTDLGNRRYAPATLENLVKEMKGGAGAEGFFYGVGNIRAVATPKFKNLNQVKAARENIITKEEFEPIKKQIDDAFQSINERLRKLDNQAGYGYDAPDALYEIGQTRNVNLLDKIYKDVPKSLKADVQIFMNKVREMPTEYFEIKPQRALQVEEFKGAILPENAPKQSIEYLKSQGIKDLYYYATPEERKELFKKFAPEMFGVLPLGLLADEEQRKKAEDYFRSLLGQ
jgi:hypothetical protein